MGFEQSDGDGDMTVVSKKTNPGIEHLPAAADQFLPPRGTAEVREYGNGNINDTFLVTPGCKETKRFILQRINTAVFLRPDLVMLNARTVTEHVVERLRREPVAEGRRWETPRVLTARDERDWWIDPGGSFWRAMSFIEAAQSHEVVEDTDHAREVGWALGMFQNLISDLPAERLEDTLVGFHVTPLYLRRYDEVSAVRRPRKSPQMDYAARFVSGRRSRAAVLENGREGGLLRLRPIHGDPKVNNIMVGTVSRRAVGMIDLDTVKPGLVHHDIGDCLRSCCNPLGEETECWETVRFENDLCRAILQGYLPRAKLFFTGPDYEYLFDAIRLIPFELGLRFLTDYLEGSVYFKARHGEHNLVRSLVQFKLAESIESQEPAIRSLIREVR
jgi:Ser/Thr protein kinase RdoA (MazF antagonist)